MSKNGFFHERPEDEDIYVTEAMLPVIGRASINGHVKNVRHEGHDLIADVEYEGQTYTAMRQGEEANRYWIIVQGPVK